jgi:hypothetical protein
MMVAWEAYKATDEFQSSKRWALTIAPMLQAGSPDFELKRSCDVMPFEQRSNHVDGSLWAAFVEGWNAAKAVSK